MQTTCDANKITTTKNNLELFSTTSQLIGQKLLRGWIMLDQVCNLCKVTPLLKQKNKDDLYCAQCDVFFKIVDNDYSNGKTNEDTVSEINTTNKKENDQLSEKRQDYNMKFENDKTERSTTCNNWEHPTYSNKEEDEEEKENNNTYTNSLFENNVKYIKEIKLQNEEFNTILNKNNISKEEIKNLFGVKDYIKERCGYQVGKWLYSSNNENNDYKTPSKMKKKNTEKVETNEESNTIQNNYFKREKSINEKTMNHTQYDDTYFQNDYNKYKKESFILEKTKYVLYNKLEKYGSFLEETHEQADESAFLNKISEIIQTLKNINDIKSRIIV